MTVQDMESRLLRVVEQERQKHRAFSTPATDNRLANHGGDQDATNYTSNQAVLQMAYFWFEWQRQASTDKFADKSITTSF